jgi:hypothetical protein
MQAIFLNLVTPRIENELRKFYRDPSELIDLWNRTQVREPLDLGEVEDVFYGI